MPDDRASTCPSIAPPAHAAVLADAATGIILCPDGVRWWQAGMPSPWRVFPDRLAARAWADAMVARFPRIECNLVDHDHRTIERVWNPASFERPAPPPPWWKRWGRAPR